MSRPGLFLCHGWGFDRSFWEPLSAVLDMSEIHAPDRGYFGLPAAVPTERVHPAIAITHSFGTMAFLDAPPKNICAMIVINGFARFSEAQDFKSGVPRRLVRRMRQRFAEAPEIVVTEFRARCGCDDPLPGPPDIARLDKDLRHLETSDLRPAFTQLRMPVLILGAVDDPILPKALTENIATLLPATRLDWSEGGHLLPLTRTRWCADRIHDFLGETGLA